MSTDVKEVSSDFALVYRWLGDDDTIHSRLLAVVADVPDAVGISEVKQTVGVMGQAILQGLRFYTNQDDKAEIDWGKGYKLVKEADWDGPLAQRVDELRERALMTNMVGEWSGERVASIGSTGTFVWMEDEDSIRLISYNDLLDDLKGEKRITLRLPLELHSLLASGAYRNVSSSLNSFCINTLAKAVNYDEEKLERFEAERRKPGRPKKVQDSE